MDRVEYFPKNSEGVLNYEKIKSAVEELNPDIVHFQWGNLGEDILSKIEFSVPVVVSFHSYITPQTWKVSNKGFDSVFKKADVILPISDYIKRGLISMGCNHSKIIVHHMGVDTNLFPFSLKVAKEKVEILSVGSFIEKKGFQDAFKAIGQLPVDILKKVQYKIIGDGPMKEEYLEIINQLNIKNNVEFLGKLTQDSVAIEFQKADIYLHPSVISSEGDDEGIPTVIMEAQSCGLPIVSTLHTGIPELVDSGVSGLLSTEHDIKTIRDNILKLIMNENLRVKMGSAGRKKVLKEFDADKLNVEMLDIYKKLI
jgi:colanic acid/amylovoran biosynthesis glycosyltransferase